MSRHGRPDDEPIGARHEDVGRPSHFGPPAQDEWYRPRHGVAGSDVAAAVGADGNRYDAPPEPPFDDAPTTEHVFDLHAYETRIAEARAFETHGRPAPGGASGGRRAAGPDTGGYRYTDYEQPAHDESGYGRFGYPPPEDGARRGETPPARDRTVAAGRAAPEPVGPSPARGDRARSAGRRRSRGRVLGMAAVLVLLLGGGFFAYRMFAGPDLPPDYAGPGGPEVVVQVRPGDTAEEIGAAFKEKDIVASSDAFYNAAVQNPGMNSLHPGFYAIGTRLPARDAVAALVDPANRVGAIVISEGRQLHDVRDVNTGAVRKGIYTLIAEASCLDRGGERTCLTYQDLDAAGSNTDLAALGVPEWAREAVANVPDRSRQLEGLIAAGSWDFDPTAPPLEILRSLVSASAARYDETGITAAAAKVGLTPYQMLVAASLVEREALPDDFSKVARVILNRLKIGQPLQFDSTVNYALDETELATTDADRARVTPWNTYASPGLPATPISSPSIEALQAVESPAPGDWTYFVTVDSQGTTLFTNSYEEHLTNTERALESGILDSGR